MVLVKSAAAPVLFYQICNHEYGFLSWCEAIKKYLPVSYLLNRHVLTDPDQDLVKLIFEFGKGFSSMADTALFFSG